MKHFLFILLSVFSLLSCERIDLNDIEKNSTQEGGVTVSFQIGSIEQIPFENTSTRATIASLCTRFTIAVFQGDTKVNAVNQTSDSESFGTITMSLQPGDYQLVAIAHNGLGNCTVTSPEKITFSNNKMTDTFYYYGTLSITTDCTQQLALKRAVSMFRLLITDNMPESVAQMKFYYTGGSSTFNAVTGYGCVNSKQTETFSIASDAYGKPSTFEIYSFPHALTDTLKITATALDASGTTVKENVYENMPIKLNAITQHSTTFFTGVSGTSSMTGAFSIEGNGEWTETMDR